MLLLGSAPAIAEPAQGDKEIQGAASFLRPIGSGSGAFNADARYGYFVSPEWQLGLRQSYTLVHNDDSADVWNAVTAPYAIYHFNNGTSPMVPYLGAFVGAVWNDEDFTGTVGPQGGVKYYFASDTFLNAEYRYEWFFDEIGDADEIQDANHAVVLGIGYNWS
jgi:hypothetical protein